MSFFTSLQEEACLAAIAPFYARRGPLTKIFSDNATNCFVSRTDLDTGFEIDAFTTLWRSLGNINQVHGTSSTKSHEEAYLSY